MAASKSFVRYTTIPKLPYSLDRTCQRLSRFEERVDRYENGVYRRLVHTGRKPALVEVEQEGPPSRARLVVRISDGRAREQAERLIERVLGARSSVQPFYRRFRDDALLGPLLARHRGLRVVGRRDAWECLLQIVLSQQVNLSLAHGILSELAERYGRWARIGSERFHEFPEPGALAAVRVAELRRMRLSQAKAETLKRLGKGFDDGILSDEKLRALPDDEAIELLTSFKGVGRWTAEFVLLRGLGRLDVFPAGDLGVVKYVAQQLLGYRAPASESEMRDFAERWRPYRGLALIYAYAELSRQTTESRAKSRARRPRAPAPPSRSPGGSATRGPKGRRA